MKKTLALLFAVLMVFAMCACGSTDSGNSEQAESTPTPTADVPKSEGDLGDYYVKILDYALVSDYEGNPAIIVNYEFTNNSEDDTMPMVAVTMKAFQDGVELSDAFIADSSIYDAEPLMKEIKPGATIACQEAYELTSETSDVEINVEEAFSFDDAELVQVYQIAQ